MKSVLITGGSRGLGLELARQMAARGDRVIATVRRAIDAARLPATVEMRELDVEDPESVAALGQSLEARALDIVINNAGVGEGSFYDEREGPSLENLNFSAVARMLGINAIGPMRILSAALPALRRGIERKVVNISSELGSLTQNQTGGWTGYRMSKSALNMFTRCAAGELGKDGFTCISLHPGWVRTDMGGGDAPLAPQESATGMLRVIDSVTTSQNGAFIAWNGSEIPW